MLLLGVVLSVMFALVAYDGISGRMVGKPSRFVFAGICLVLIGSTTIAAFDSAVKLIYPQLLDVSKVAEDMITGVVSAFAGALFGAAVTIKATILRDKDLKRFAERQAWVNELTERIKQSEADDKLKFVDVLIMERNDLRETAMHEGIDLKE